MAAYPTYISLDVPEPMAARVARMRGVFDPDFAHLPVEIAVTGSSGVGTLEPRTEPDAVIAAIETIARSFFPIVTRFTGAVWLDALQVYALDVEPVPPLVALHMALRSSGVAFGADVPPAFQRSRRSTCRSPMSLHVGSSTVS